MKLGIEYVWEDIYRNRQKERATGKREGRKEGRKEGILVGIRDLVKAMAENGESIDTVRKYSGLSSKDFDKILKELNLTV